MRSTCGPSLLSVYAEFAKTDSIARSEIAFRLPRTDALEQLLRILGKLIPTSNKTTPPSPPLIENTPGWGLFEMLIGGGSGAYLPNKRFTHPQLQGV